jgi:hypothetical protein
MCVCVWRLLETISRLTTSKLAHLQRAAKDKAINRTNICSACNWPAAVAERTHLVLWPPPFHNSRNSLIEMLPIRCDNCMGVNSLIKETQPDGPINAHAIVPTATHEINTSAD